MIFSVAHEDIPVGHDCDSLEALELRVSSAPAAEGAQEGALRVENLDAIIAAVSNEDEALVVHCHAPEMVECS